MIEYGACLQLLEVAVYIITLYRAAPYLLRSAALKSHMHVTFDSHFLLAVV